ncbi:MAG: coenzyme F420-0:L-glutamate ligase [Acidaminococcaceae bacterium]|jgi:F420-0:gamma-glutamyl ligase|nr:coenzyme F420-0:L-glutamate ligase [Acidaminococcaceae bacterium]
MNKKYEIIPIPTRILTVHDDIVDAINEFGKGKVGPRDVVCVAESVVAITQNRAFRNDDIHPGFWAKNLSQLFPQKGSIANPYSMQSLMNEEGTGKVIWAVICGIVGKCMGKSGVFYEKAGEQARLIDDVTGTMPPYDKHIVYGPKNPKQVAERIARETGAFGGAVADVNDLKRAFILGASQGVDPKEIAQILIDNPFGNASEKTPICVIKNYKQN